MSVWVPNVDFIEAAHEELVALFLNDEDPISPPGVKTQGLLESAANRPFTSLGKVEKYPTALLKLSALFHSLTKNHAFHNGNKRTATVVLLTSLYQNDLRLREVVNDDELFDFVIRVTSDDFPHQQSGMNADEVVEAIAEWLRLRTEKVGGKASTMKVHDFLASCRKAGARIKNAKGGSYVISTNNGNIRLSKSTPEISGPVVRRFLRQLGMSFSVAGFDQLEFQEGVNPEREQVRRYMVTLRRLAKT